MRARERGSADRRAYIRVVWLWMTEWRAQLELTLTKADDAGGGWSCEAWRAQRAHELTLSFMMRSTFEKMYADTKGHNNNIHTEPYKPYEAQLKVPARRCPPAVPATLTGGSSARVNLNVSFQTQLHSDRIAGWYHSLSWCRTRIPWDGSGVTNAVIVTGYSEQDAISKHLR